MAYTSVKINAEANSFKSQMKSAATEVKVLAAGFNAAEAKAKAFGSASDVLKAKAEGLTAKIAAQKNIVQLNSEQQEKLTSKLAEQKSKQEELRAKIETTRSAYEKSAQQTGKNSEQTKELKEELTKLENSYKTNGAAIEKTESALAKQSIQTEKSKTSLYNMEGELKKVNQELKTESINKFADGCKSAGEKMDEFGRKLSVVSAGVGALVAKSGESAIEFEDAVAKVSTIMDESVMSIGDMRSAITELSDQTGIDASQIADNVYNAISAGQKTGDAVNFVRESTKLATAGFAESADTLDLLTTILNAYDLESEKVTDVSDMLIQTQNLGKTTVGELAGAMGKIIPTANANNVALDQVCAGYARMTANGVATAETTTYMNSMLNELGKTGSSTDKILREKTGQSFRELMQSGSSLGDVLALIDSAAKEQNLTLSDMFSSSEAAKAGLILLGDGEQAAKEGIELLDGDTKSFNATLEQMRESTGMTETAFGKMKTSGYDIKVTINELKNTALDFGQALLEGAAPCIQNLSDNVHTLSTWFKSLDSDQKQTIVRAALVVAAIGPVTTGIGKMTKGISTAVKTAQTAKGVIAEVVAKVVEKTTATTASTVAETAATASTTAQTVATTAQTTATTAATGATTALGVAMKVLGTVGVVGIIAGIIAAIVLLVKNWDKVTETVNKLRSSMKEGWNDIKQTVTGKMSEIKQSVTTGWENMKQSVSTKTTEWKQDVSTKLSQMQQDFSTKTTAIKSRWSQDFTNLKDNAGSMMELARATTSQKLTAMKSSYDAVGGGIKGIVAAYATGIRSTMETAMTVANAITGGKLDNIRSAFSDKLGSARSIAASTMDGIKSTFSGKMEEARSAVANTIDRIRGTFNFTWSLPHLNLPHISVNGGKSPYGIGGKGSLPSFNIQWYKYGAIMTEPTIFGMNGDKWLGGGEAGSEAILPLIPFYNELNSILDRKLQAVQSYVTTNVVVYTYIDGDEVASRTVTKVDEKMARDERGRR